MNRSILQEQVRDVAVHRHPTARTPEGLSVNVPSWHFQDLNAGWWRYYAGREDLSGVNESRVIAETLEEMDRETAREEVKKLPSETVKQARGIHYDLGKGKVSYEKGGSNGDSEGT